ncbi:MAG: stage 0 sporulation family protein [Lachnospiraceae bacterium]|nr:stage 0 sporulation family protein [Lachnospiraceae bacterium]
MIKIIGVRFRDAGKVYYFDPKSYEIKSGGHVIVETARGIEYGTAVGGVREVEDDKVVQPLKEVIRIATEEDDARARRNHEREKEAMRVCREKIQKHGLEMKLIDAEYTFDNNKILFYFTADGRIDFRELVKDLASVFRTRIELRQVGVRDETRLLGGIGTCGRVLCCHSYLPEFEPVSIRMAKEQNLSLNPTKISGICGRLMCCLKNEEETYEYLNSRLPSQGDTVTTTDGRKGNVQSVNVLRQRVKVIFEEGEEKELEEFDVADLQFHPRRRREKPQKNSHKNREKGSGNGNSHSHAADAQSEEEKELRELEELDHKEGKSGKPRRN